MSYEDCREVIALYANDALQFFSDRWMRFPNEEDAKYIVNRLGEVQAYFEESDFSISDKINKARCEILANSLYKEAAP